MTNQELRIAVADADGWINIHEFHEKLYGDFKMSTDILAPNYPEDLTAIHAAVNRKDSEFRRKFDNAQCFQALRLGKVFCELTAKDWCEVFVEVSKTFKDK